ncbi:type II toxin-antitoxin system VapC family toxin [Methylomonas paludis]|uniref:Ribonuclease VapC n=1 Tax=Methylomonas paludis TaxID=1173101 RepID=A0A975R9L5_9GAMM|nr:type II toxin-antitoxin system VapC family toxin [Methylomonas paludis]QWF71555.1 type II toxin-antitoxin system VapC family toxin [Methylomonas paludis]
MSFLLDTNVCVVYLNQPDSKVGKQLLSRHPHDIAVCSVVKSELFYGAMKSQRPQQTLEKQQIFLSAFHSLPFDDTAALIFGQIRADLYRQGKPIGPYDLQIAAIALANNLTLVTHNTNEFSRINGLQLDDWEL